MMTGPAVEVFTGEISLETIADWTSVE